MNICIRFDNLTEIEECIFFCYCHIKSFISYLIFIKLSSEKSFLTCVHAFDLLNFYCGEMWHLLTYEIYYMLLDLYNYYFNNHFFLLNVLLLLLSFLIPFKYLVADILVDTVKSKERMIRMTKTTMKILLTLLWSK